MDLRKGNPVVFFFPMAFLFSCSNSPFSKQALSLLPFVSLAAVVGLPDSELGETVCVCIVLREGSHGTAEEVIDFCKKQLANYKVPKRVEFMDSLPSTLATNKIRKSALVEELKARLGL